MLNPKVMELTVDLIDNLNRKVIKIDAPTRLA